MRSLHHLILASLVSLGVVLGTTPATPSASKLSLDQDQCRSQIENHEADSICQCGHHHDTEQIESAKVDAEAYPNAVCTAPEPLATSRTDPLTFNIRAIKDEPVLKRVSVTAMVRQALVDQKRFLQAKRTELKQWGSPVQVHFARWFGTTDEEARDTIQERIGILLKINEKYTEANFRRSENPSPGIFAYVRSTDPTRVFLDNAFVTAPAIGVNSKAGTLSHEMSHFRIAGGTKDHAYGESKCRELAKTKPELALTNADNFEFFIENAR